MLQTFPALEQLKGVLHGFILKQPRVKLSGDRVIQCLKASHENVLQKVNLSFAHLWFPEQVHGDYVVSVPPKSREKRIIRGADGLVTATRGEYLGVYVADCCAVYLVDPLKHVCGLVHSGRRGTESEIVVKTIQLMERQWGSSTYELIVQLSPCIRPPAYEVDFAAEIRDQCIRCGVLEENVHDEGICTTSDAQKYYSYRKEKGKTGRMLAFLGMRP